MRLNRTLLLAVLALSFGARVLLLDGQSLWTDEAISVSRATESLREITEAAPHEGTLPPLYYYLLHLWEPVAGTSEFAVRFISVVFGVLTVVALYNSLRITSGFRPAVTAAVLAAFSPFWVYYSQEARMYAQVTCFAAVSTWLFLEIASRRDARQSRTLYASYVLASSAAVFSHYFGGFVLLAQSVLMGTLLAHDAMSAARSPSGNPGWAAAAIRQAAAWSAAQIAILLLLTPWVLYTRESLLVTAGAVERASISMADIARHLLITFTLGTSVPESLGLLASLPILALAVLATVRRPLAAAVWWALLLVPVLAIAYVSFTPYPGWARYFMVASPAWLALAAIGLESILPSRNARESPPHRRRTDVLRRIAFCLVLLSLAAAFCYSLRAYYTDPKYARYDWRGAVARLESSSLPSEAVILNGPPWLPEFDYYFRGTLPRYELPRPGLRGQLEIETELRRAAAAHTGLWLVKYYPPDVDPDGIVERWLAEHAFRASGDWVENATFSFYSLPQPGPSSTTPVGAQFGKGIILQEARLSRVPARAGSLLQLTLVWRATQPITEDYTVFAHLVTADGQLVSQRDSPPLSGFRPTSGWDQGDVVEDRVALAIPPGAPATPLTVQVGLYRSADGSRLPAIGGPSGAGSDFAALPAP